MNRHRRYISETVHARDMGVLALVGCSNRARALPRDVMADATCTPDSAMSFCQARPWRQRLRDGSVKLRGSVRILWAR